MSNPYVQEVPEGTFRIVNGQYKVVQTQTAYELTSLGKLLEQRLSSLAALAEKIRPLLNLAFCVFGFISAAIVLTLFVMEPPWLKAFYNSLNNLPVYIQIPLMLVLADVMPVLWAFLLGGVCFGLPIALLLTSFGHDRLRVLVSRLYRKHPDLLPALKLSHATVLRRLEQNYLPR